MKLSDNLTAWGTVALATLTALGMGATILVYAVTTAENVAHCARKIDNHESRLNSIDGHVNNIEGYLRIPRPPQTAAN